VTPADKLALLQERVELRGGNLHWRASGNPIPLNPDHDGYMWFTIHLPYVEGRKGSAFFRAHRAIWALHFGDWPQQTLDHINRDRADNRIENLRDVSHQENQRNRSITRMAA
jgi:hypothetical protein